MAGWMNITRKKTYEATAYNPTYPFESLKAARQLQKIAKYARDSLKEIECPVYIAHTKNDQMIDPIGTEWIEKNVTGSVKIEWFDKSGHTMPLDVAAMEISEAIAEFLINYT